MQTLKRLPLWGVYGLLAYMPFHIFLSQWLSTRTGGLDAWKVGKDVVTMGLLVGCLGLALARDWRRQKILLLAGGVALLYLLLHIGLYFLNRDTSQDVGALATVYNNRLLWYLLIGLTAARLLPAEVNPRQVARVIVLVSTIVCLLGLLQHYLPKDLMTHFGYSVERGVKPAFFIDDKPDLPRVMSTLRDPNSLGAFLVLPILLIVQRLLDKAKRNARLLNAGLLILHLQVLLLTFSRGAWAALIVSVIALGVMRYRSLLANLLKKFWPWLATGILVVATGFYLLRDQYVVQNIIFHSDENTAAALDSNELHASFIQQGVRGIAEQPLGHGPGTAGIVSIQNQGGGLLTENYFVQIGYEVGIAGLLLFIAALLFTQKKLQAAPATELSAALIAAFWGYLLMAMVAHLWTNEVVAVYWWLPAGVVIGAGLKRRDARRPALIK